jgi:hypothetical protein
MEHGTWNVERVFLLTSVCVLACLQPAHAEDSARRLDPVAWMRVAVGARAQAMGGAFTARADDGTAPYWNPAFIESFGPYETQVALMALPLSLERRAAYAGYIQKLGHDWGSLAASWTYYRIGAIDQRDDSGLRTGDLEDVQNAFALSYGLPLGDDLKVGATVKYYLHQLPGATGSGLGLDLAAAFHPKGPWLRWQFGAALKELSPGMFWTTGVKEGVQPALRLGAAYHIIYDQLLAALDLEFPYGQKVIPHSGLEWWAWDTVAIRAGLDTSGLYVGAGYRYGPYQFDYSYSTLLEGISDEHRITIMFKL